MNNLKKDQEFGKEQIDVLKNENDALRNLVVTILELYSQIHPSEKSREKILSAIPLLLSALETSKDRNKLINTLVCLVLALST